MNIPSVLVEESNLTEAQLESLLSYVRVVGGGMRLKEAAASRAGKSVTVGSYYRTVQQGRARVRESMVTVLVAVAIGLVRVEDVRKLFELFSSEGAQVAEEDRKRFADVLRALLDRIVT